MSRRVFLGILYTGDFLLFLLTEYMTDVQACSLKERLGIFIVSVIHRTHTLLDTSALCGLMLGVSCQGLFIFFGARWGEERNRCAEETVMLKPCWRCAGSLGWSCVPLPAATVATVIGNDGQPAGKTGEAACWLGLRRQGRGVGVEEPGVCVWARIRGRERWKEKDTDGERCISVAELLK